MPTRIEVNCETGEVQEIELTAKEIAELEKAAADAAARKAEEDAAATAKAAKRDEVLKKLGLSEDDIAALIG